MQHDTGNETSRRRVRNLKRTTLVPKGHDRGLVHESRVPTTFAPFLSTYYVPAMVLLPLRQPNMVAMSVLFYR